MAANNRPKLQPSQSDKPKPNLFSQICAFDKSYLNKLTVYTVSCCQADVWLPLKTHGFAVIGTDKHRHGFTRGRVYYLGAHIMDAPYELNNKIIQHVNKSEGFSQLTKQALHFVEKRQYPSAECFLKALLQQKAVLTGDDLSNSSIQEQLFTQAAFPRGELRKLVSLNNSINGVKGAVLPKPRTGFRCKRDIAIFENSNATKSVKPLPLIEPEQLRRVYNDQVLFSRYLHEKAGTGQSTALMIKTQQSRSQLMAAKYLSKFSKFNFWPSRQDAKSSNCNKATASLLQLAENASARNQHRQPQFITGASLWAVGDRQRMALWQPLQSNSASF